MAIEFNAKFNTPESKQTWILLPKSSLHWNLFANPAKGQAINRTATLIMLEMCYTASVHHIILIINANYDTLRKTSKILANCKWNGSLNDHPVCSSSKREIILFTNNSSPEKQLEFPSTDKMTRGARQHNRSTICNCIFSFSDSNIGEKGLTLSAHMK